MHVAFIAPPAHGHVNPTLPLVEELVRRGHRVSYATGSTMLATVEKSGATPIELPWSLDTGRVTNNRTFDPENFFVFLGMLTDAADEYIPVLIEQFQQDRPDVVCTGRMAVLAAETVEKLGLLRAEVHASHAVNEQFNMQRAFSDASFDENNPMLVEAKQKIADVAAKYGLPPRLDAMVSPPAGLNLVFLPRVFQIAGDTFDDRYHFIGPSMGSRAESDEWQPPTDGKPVLFISLGTAFNDRPEFFTMCTEAFGDSDWHVVMAVGEAVDPAILGQIPDNFEVRSYFPQPVVLGHAKAFISHTGMNSTMESLYCAVPLVSVPQMPEQAANGDRVQELGLGRRLDPDALTPQLLRDAVRDVADDPAIRTNVVRFSKQMRTSGGAAAGVDALEAYVSGKS